MTFIVGSIIIGVSLIAAGATVKGIEASVQKKKANKEEKRRNKLEKQYKALQDSRQEVIDQSDEIRSLKDEIYNPYANLGVAMQATNMKMEETDEDLANILQSVNEAGAGGGAATQLARMGRRQRGPNAYRRRGSNVGSIDLTGSVANNSHEQAIINRYSFPNKSSRIRRTSSIYYR